MSERDRILAATGRDEEQADLVQQMIRRAKEARPDVLAGPELELADEMCPNCLKEYDEAGFCDGCARQRRVR